jgi:hypothetical protein
VNTDDSHIYAYVVVRNAGLAAIDVERMNLSGVSQGSWAHMIILSEIQPSRGEQLPARVEPSSALQWEFAFSPVEWDAIRAHRSRGWRRHFDRHRLDVYFGDGSKATYDAEPTVVDFLTNRDDMWRNARFRAVYRRVRWWL